MLAANGTLPAEINPTIKNTSIIAERNYERFLGKDFSIIEGLNDYWRNSVIPKEESVTARKLGFEDYENKIRESGKELMGVSNLVIKDYENIIQNIVKVFEKVDELIVEGHENFFQKIFDLQTITEKEQFISKHFLQESINEAQKLINNIFGNIETYTELYTDPEEPDYRFLNITMAPRQVSENEIESLFNKFDKLQDQFLDTVEKKYASKITFHLDII